jgi:hypothetical protein
MAHLANRERLSSSAFGTPFAGADSDRADRTLAIDPRMLRREQPSFRSQLDPARYARIKRPF